MHSDEDDSAVVLLMLVDNTLPDDSATNSPMRAADISKDTMSIGCRRNFFNDLRIFDDV